MPDATAAASTYSDSRIDAGVSCRSQYTTLVLITSGRPAGSVNAVARASPTQSAAPDSTSVSVFTPRCARVRRFRPGA